MNMKVLAVLSFGVALTAHAATVNNINQKGYNDGQSIFSTSVWGITAFNEEDDYVLAYGYLKEGLNAGTFGGKSFRVATGKSFQPNVASSVTTFPRDGIIFEKNSTLRYWNTANANQSITLKGAKMTIEDGSSSQPLWIKTTKASPYGCTYNLDLPLVGSSSAYIKMTYYADTYHGWSKICLNADSPDFKGVIMVCGNNNELEFNTGNFGGGKLYLEPPCRVTMPSNCNAQTQWLQLGNFAGTSKLAYRWNGDPGNPQYGYLNIYQGDFDHGLITFPEAAHNIEFEVPTELAVYCAESTEDAENPDERAVTLLTTKQTILSGYQGRFSLTMTGTAPYGADSTVTPTLRFTAIEGGGTRVQAVGTWRKLKYSYLKTGDSSAADNHGSSLQAKNADNWTDSTTMDPTVSYVVTKGLQLMTHQNVPVFTGDRLILEGRTSNSRSRLALVTGSFTVTNLFCHGGSMIQAYSTETHLKGGPVCFLPPIAGTDPCIIFMPPANNVSIAFMLDVPIVCPGSMGLDMLYQGGDNGKCCSEIHLNQPSPDHKGFSQIGLNASYNPSVSTPETKYLTVYFNDPLCFGGAASSYLSNGLRVDGDQRIRPTQTMTFEDNLNRGFISADKGARLDIPEGVTLTFKQPMLWMGPLTKMGPGTFARGGTYEPRFKTSDNNDPGVYETGASNTWFNVREGAVTALATNAFNGVTMRFSEDGALLVDAATTDAALRKYGVVNTKIDAPFVSVPADGKIALTFAYGEKPFAELPPAGEKVAVCTVKGDAAEAPLLDVFKVVRPRGARVTLSAEAADGITGAYTVFATVERTGLMIIIK